MRTPVSHHVVRCQMAKRAAPIITEGSGAAAASANSSAASSIPMSPRRPLAKQFR